jgi:predicted TIM-barrel fold metal-dependent hydrolase
MRRALLAVATAPLFAASAQAPLVDHHQHFFGAQLLAWSSTFTPAAATFKPIGATELVALLDSAGIRRALVLSVAYQYGNPTRVVENEYEKVKAENDWTSQQVALYPDRLRAFCSVNPTRDYALDEIARCAKDPQLRAGLKLHFGNSDVDVHDPNHLARLKRVFRAANDNRMPIVVHMRGSVNKGRPHGRAEALIFLNDLLPAAPDVPVQIAHLAGAGSYDDSTDHAAAVFGEALAAHDPRATRLYIDASMGVAGMTAERKQLVVSRMRQIGLDRILFGSDGAVPGNSPRENWAAFRTLPFRDEEFRAIANNVAPYMK